MVQRMKRLLVEKIVPEIQLIQIRGVNLARNRLIDLVIKDIPFLLMMVT
jgi:hypothetical protein